MSRILILYFSGVGNTKRIAENMYLVLKQEHEVTICSIEKLPSSFSFEEYDKLMIGSSTIHSEPAKPMKEYLKGIDKLSKPIPAFLFITCGLYSENTLRVFSKYCLAKNIIPVMHSAYRCSATDGVLLVPGVKRFWKDEKNLERRIRYDTKKFSKIDSLQPIIPRYKWYGILNFPNKCLGKYIRFKIFLHKEMCIKCGKCIKKCPEKALDKTEDGYPKIDRSSCINCYRCIHHCPKKALSLSAKKTPKKTLY
ncbi:MAG: EFR1 family ferrodoxin [Lachnospiraceae bacterium]|nr:EFR1 family ferrodoxin [Lachnospiraceae bacterium]